MKSVQVLIYEGADELDVVGPFEVLAAAGFEVELVDAGGSATVRGAHGLSLTADRELASPDLLIVPGGGWISRAPQGAWAEVQRGVLPTRIAECHRAGTVVAGVCTGVMLLAAGGMLLGRPAVTHHAALGDLQDTGAVVRPDARVVDEGDVLTAGGVTAAIDLALHIVRRRRGHTAAREGARRMEYAPAGPVVEVLG
jgi:transcriptional regulator GlxA family with amidase domain